MSSFRVPQASLSLVLFLLATIVAAGQGRGGELDQVELQSLDRYLDQLSNGGAADAKLVDALADVSWPAIEKTIRRYAELPDPIEPHTHRAFQALIERTTRTALQPWMLVETYSPEFAAFVNDVGGEDSLSKKLFVRFANGAPDRRTWDLAVRLCPASALEHVYQTNHSQHADLFDAWNRRLASGRISQPIPKLDERLDRISKWPQQEPLRLFEARLEFLGRWPQVRAIYERRIDFRLGSADGAKNAAAIRVQTKIGAGWEQISEIPLQFNETWSVPFLQCIAADTKHDHSVFLRRLWSVLPKTETKLRYNALLAMAVHSKGNQELALDALREQPFEYLDAALGVLRTGNEAAARSGIEFLLYKVERGHEEALRLATERKLKGFEQPAIKLALDDKSEAIARQTALHYLQLARGALRRKVLSLLTIKNGDIRLAAIQTFGPPDGLSEADRNEIGPELIRVAKEDRLEGNRQEAIFSLGLWADPQAASFFRELLTQNPPVILIEEPFNSELYWRYRYRLVALTGLARLGDMAAMEELTQLHHRGGPTEKMDVLLALLSLKQCPPWVVDDLKSDEPKLIATSMRVVLDHGSPEQKQALKDYFGRTRVWQQFRDSGVDDHGLLKMMAE